MRAPARRRLPVQFARPARPADYFALPPRWGWGWVNTDIAAGGSFLGAFGFFFSRLPRDCPLATAVLLD